LRALCVQLERHPLLQASRAATAPVVWLLPWSPRILTSVCADLDTLRPEAECLVLPVIQELSKILVDFCRAQSAPVGSLHGAVRQQAMTIVSVRRVRTVQQKRPAHSVRLDRRRYPVNQLASPTVHVCWVGMAHPVETVSSVMLV
jgi:hypothetical protein